MNPPESAASAAVSAEIRTVFRAHVDRVYGYLIHRLGGRTAIAEELTRNVFTRSIGDLDDADEADAVEARLVSVARQELVVFLDRAARKPDLVLGPPGIASMTVSKAERTALDQLERLPVEQRLAVILHHIDALPVGLVAESTTQSLKSTEETLAGAGARPGFDPASLALLDTLVAPDTAFADEVEQHLVQLSRDGSPKSSAALAPGAESAGGVTPGGDARFAPNQTPRLALAALAVFAIIALVVRGMNSGGETEPDLSTATPSTADSADSTTASSSTSAVVSSTSDAPSTTLEPVKTEPSTSTTTSAAVTPTSTAVTDEERRAPGPSDPAFLPRGPLSRRGGHQTLWTGAEMIVWGGSTDDRIALTNGAAFDPRVDSWRLLADPPIDEATPTAAVWAGDQMIVVAPDVTLAYRQWLDDWVRLGDGIEPGPAIWTGRAVVLANSDGISMFDLTTGAWTPMPDPGIRQMRDEDDEPFLMIDKFEFGLHMLDGDLYFVRGCGPNIWRWTGLTWSATARPSFGDLASSDNVIFCAWANQTAVVDGRILVWSDDQHPSIIYDPKTDTWDQLANPPLPGTEGPVGGMTLDDRVLAVNWEAAVFDATTEQWSSVALPGELMHDDGMVWTGSEVLLWGADNSWRTTLPR